MAARIHIEFLLAVLHAVNITDEFAARTIRKWPSELCDAPANREELRSHVESIWQEWVGDGVTPCPDPIASVKHSGTVVTSAPGPAQRSTSTSLAQRVIVIDDDNDDKIQKSNTLALLRNLSVSAPAASHGSAASPSVQKSGYTSIIIIDDSDDDEVEEADTSIQPLNFKMPVGAGLAPPQHGQDTPTISRVCSVATNNAVAFLGPESMTKQVAVKNAKTRNLKAKSAHSSKGNKKSVDDKNDSNPNEMFANPFSLGSCRKRRPKIDYNHVPECEVYDRSEEEDDDFEYEERDDDDRLDQEFEKKYPELDTPSKRQKTKK